MGARFGEIADRLRWVVGSDRDDVAVHDASDLTDRDHDDVPERETATLADRILKNLELIRAYEASRDD